MTDDTDTDDSTDESLGFWTMEGPDGSLEVHTCPGCDYTATAEDVREEGGCLHPSCEWELPESARA